MHPEASARNHRKQVRWIAASLIVVALLVAACSGTSTSGSNGDASAQVTTTPAVALEQPSVRCGAPETKATLIRFQAPDGTSLNGVMVGRGPAGVVLAHEYPNDLCGSWPFADYLAKRGLRAFAIDLRCFGRSACPEGDARGRVVDDLNAGAAVEQLTVPTMLVVATNDRYVSVEKTRTMYQAVRNRDKRLEVLSGPFDGQHGWQLVNDPATGEFSSAAAKDAAFLTAHTRGRTAPSDTVHLPDETQLSR